jgi:undecaprenyl-diphosphatase
MSNRMRFYLSRMVALDSALCVSFSQTSHNRLIRDWFRMISRLGDGVFWYTLMLAILITQQMDGVKPFLHMAIVGLTGTLIYKWLKEKTHRPRPYQVNQDVWAVGKPLDHFSFPSGHTLHAVAFSLVAISYFPILAPALLTFTLMIAMSRVILGLHYPSDVFAGATIGYLITQISFILF